MSDDRHYTGITKNIDNRLLQHNKGYSISTRNHLPVTLIHAEVFQLRKEARKREVYIKNYGAGRYLKYIKFYRNGKDKDISTNYRDSG